LVALLAAEDAAAPGAAARLLAARLAADTHPAPATAATLGDLRLAHDLAVNRGLAGDAERAMHGIALSNAPLARRIRVTDALYGDGDSVAGSYAARQLAARADRPPLDATDQAAHLTDACVVALWRLERGDPRGDERGTRTVLAWLRDPSAAAPSPDTVAIAAARRAVAAREQAVAAARRRGRRARPRRTPAIDSAALTRAELWRVPRTPVAREEAQRCATLLEAAGATTRHVDLRRPADRLDSLLRVAPAGTLADDAGRFVLARLLVRQGRPPRRARRAPSPPVPVRPARLRGARAARGAALAERARDRAGALVAWRRYATLRADADPALRADAARAWAEVRRLEGK
jgi:hypothetical protein